MEIQLLRHLQVLVAIVLAALAVSGCGSTDNSTTSSGAAGTTGTTTTGGDVDTSAGVRAATWSDNVSIDYAEGSFTYTSNGIPAHELPDQFLIPDGQPDPSVAVPEATARDSDEVVTETPLDVTIPTGPVYSDTVTQTSLGTIGVLISGAPLFNDYENPDRSLVAIDDNFSVGGVDFLDACNGHPLAMGQGTYHYHGVPYCITDTLDTPGEHSKVLGFLLDGFPVYGPQDTGGVKVTTASAGLDECNGHVGPTPEFPNGIYHYHLKDDKSPYTPDCYHGEVSTTGAGDGGNGQQAPPAGGPPGAPPGGPPGTTTG